MPSFYKPNKKVTGCAANFSFNSKEGALFTNLIRQVSYDDSRHIGSFSGGDKIVIKSGVTEIGAFLDVLNRNVEYSTVHTTKDTTVSIKFSPYITDEKVQKGYGLSIFKKTKEGKEQRFLIGFTFAEASVLKSYFDFVLRHIFSAEYAQEKKDFKDRQDSKSKVNTVSKPEEVEEI